MPPASSGGSTRAWPRTLIVLAAVLLVARIGVVTYEKRHPPERADLVKWRTLEAAVVESRQTRKPILYDFTADWCEPCLQMQREFFADRSGAGLIEKQFVPVRVLDRRREEGRNPAYVDSLQARYGVKAFPTLIVAMPDSTQNERIEGFPGNASLAQQLTSARSRVVLRRGFPF